MADGYARTSGKPGVCLLITGPGLSNAATAMAQACADSIPMLVITAVNRRDQLGLSNGNLHELRNQQAFASQVSAFSHTLLSPQELPGVLERAFAVFNSARPQPVHIEIPLDLMTESAANLPQARSQPQVKPRADAMQIAQLKKLCMNAAKPLILAGGGVRNCTMRLKHLAERIDAPVVMTVNARGVLASDHCLAVPASPSLSAVRNAIAEADLVLALGTEMGRTDYDMYDHSKLKMSATLVRVDIDAQQLFKNYSPDLAILADVESVLDDLLQVLPNANMNRGGSAYANTARATAWQELEPNTQGYIELIRSIRKALPQAILIGDSTQLSYAGNLYCEVDQVGTWFSSATGYGTLGFALPAAIGAQIAAPGQPIVCMIGDGGLQFTLSELGSAIDAATPIIVLLWNNQGYGEIKSYMQACGVKPEGVDLFTPNFIAIAQAYGWRAEKLSQLDELSTLLSTGIRRCQPLLVEIPETLVLLK